MKVANKRNGYAEVNGLLMYYESHGQGKPLVLIHGGGSTLNTTFANLIPPLSKYRQVIAMDLQAHGRTGDRPGDLSFEQDADDIAQLLEHLNISQADFLGYSNGGHILVEIALRHPKLVDQMILVSTFYSRDAIAPKFWEGFNSVTPDMLPNVLKEGFLEVNNDQKALRNMFYKDVQRMKEFRGWSDRQIESIRHPVLVINGNEDVAPVKHAVTLYRTLPNAQLVILPGIHGASIGSAEALKDGEWTQSYVLDILSDFLNKRLRATQ